MSTDVRMHAQRTSLDECHRKVNLVLTRFSFIHYILRTFVNCATFDVCTCQLKKKSIRKCDSDIRIREKRENRTQIKKN